MSDRGPFESPRRDMHPQSHLSPVVGALNAGVHLVPLARKLHTRHAYTVSSHWERMENVRANQIGSAHCTATCSAALHSSRWLSQSAFRCLGF
jgi:hypothetical protein